MEFLHIRDGRSFEQQCLSAAVEIAIGYSVQNQPTIRPPDLITRNWLTHDAKAIMQWFGPLNDPEAKTRFDAMALAFHNSHTAGRQTMSRLITRAEMIYDFLSGRWVVDPVSLPKTPPIAAQKQKAPKKKEFMKLS